MWKKEKMLVTSIFSFFPQCFTKGIFLKIIKKSGLCGKELNLQHSYVCTYMYIPLKQQRLHYNSFENTVGKGEIARIVTSNFSFSHSVFYPFRKHPAICIKFQIVVCKLLQFGRLKSLSFGRGLN